MSSCVAKNLTVCILVKNEEDRIVTAVASVAALGAKLLIVDAFSDDNTFNAAQLAWLEAGRDIEDFEFVAREWLGFVRSRELSATLVKTRWVMWLDSDEWVESDMRLWMESHLEYLNLDNVYGFRRQSYFLGQAVRHGGWYPDYKARLCRVGHAVWQPGPRGMPVHETLAPVKSSGSIILIDAHIGHLPFRSFDELRATNEEYSTLMAPGLEHQWRTQAQKPIGKIRQTLAVACKFIESYFLKLGFLDGAVGLRLAVGSAWSLNRRVEKARDLYWISSS